MEEYLRTDPKNAGQNQVHCDVNSCRYNDHGGVCTAKEIRIGPAPPSPARPPAPPSSRSDVPP